MIYENKINTLKQQVKILTANNEKYQSILKQYEVVLPPIIDVQNDYQAIDSLQTSLIQSWKKREFERTNTIMEELAQEKDSFLSKLNDSSIQSESSTLGEIVLTDMAIHIQNDSDTKVSHTLTKCKGIGCRMIDTICNYIPEWKNKSKTINKIKTSVSCMLENIERVLNELLYQRSIFEIKAGNQTVVMYASFNMQLIEDGKDLKQNQELYLAIENIYHLTTNHTSTKSYYSQIQEVSNSLTQLLHYTKSDCIQEVTVRIGKNHDDQKKVCDLVQRNYQLESKEYFSGNSIDSIDHRTVSIDNSSRITFSKLYLLMKLILNRIKKWIA